MSMSLRYSSAWVGTTLLIQLTHLGAGIVLMPGDTLPLKVVRRQDRLKLESALNASAPFTRLIAVVRLLPPPLPLPLPQPKPFPLPPLAAPCLLLASDTW